MSRVEVPMPQMGESITEGTVSVWLKQVGDPVGRDEPIFEISTDKVDAEIPAPAEGILIEILVKEGETVEVGTIVAYIEADAAIAAASLDPAGPAGSKAVVEAVEDLDASSDMSAGSPDSTGSPSAAPMPVTAAESLGLDVDGTVSPSDRGASATSTEALPASPAVAAGEEPPTTSEPRRVQAASPLEERLRLRSSPLVRRIAAEHDIDIRDLAGSGWMGRVTKDDILASIRNGGQGHRRGSAGEGGISWDDFYTHVEHPLVAAGPGDQVEPMSRMTQLIAEHMVISQRISPHVHSFIEVDYSRIDQVRAAHRALWAEQGAKVSYTAFIARAVAQSLREHPKVNATISGTDVIYRGEVNVGVAVALPWGLIVPVVKQADELSLVGLALRITDLAERARTKKLSPEEVQGGTFTITNPGVYGAAIGFPIVNQPQVAILGVGGVEKRAVVVTDEFGGDAIVVRKRGYLSLGFDHRLVNGADGDLFLARVRELLESVTEG